MADLITSSDVQATYGAAFAARADLALLISAASTAIENFCGRVFAQASVDELLDGNGVNFLPVSRPPIDSVTAVTVEGTALDNSGGDEWVVKESGLGLYRGDGTSDPRHAGTWPRGTSNVRAQYTGGYVTTPKPVVQAALLTVKHLADSGAATGVYASETIGDYEYQRGVAGRADVAIPLAAQFLLGPYVLKIYR